MNLKNSMMIEFTVLLFFTLVFPASAHDFMQTQRAMNSAIYNHTLLSVTPMLFHQIELGMSYDAVVNTAGKPALYCDSGESYCHADNGPISKKCLDTTFIQPHKTWMCHWDGIRTDRNSNPRLDVWFVGARVSHVTATMPNGDIYRRDAGNTIYLERHPSP